GKLPVVVVEPGLAHAQESCGRQAPTERGSRAVGGDGGRERDLALRAARLIAQAQPVARRVRAEAELTEAHLDPRVARGLLDEHAVQVGAADRPDDFMLALPVRLP